MDRDFTAADEGLAVDVKEETVEKKSEIKYSISTWPVLRWSIVLVQLMLVLDTSTLGVWG